VEVWQTSNLRRLRLGEEKKKKLEMWANAQHDGRPAEYRWRPLFNAAKFGRRPILDCRAVTLPRPLRLGEERKKEIKEEEEEQATG